MSAGVETRFIKRCYSVKASRDNRTVRVSLSGDNRYGRTVMFVTSMEFSQIPWLIEQLGKAWQEERAARASEISSIDKALPTPTTTTP